MLALLPPMSGNGGGEAWGGHTQVGLLASLFLLFALGGQ